MKDNKSLIGLILGLLLLLGIAGWVALDDSHNYR